MKIALIITCGVAAIALAGCEASAPGDASMLPAESMAPPPPLPAAPGKASPPKEEKPGDAAADSAAAPATDAPPSADAPADQEPAEPAAAPANEPGDSEEAKVGAGAKGRDYGGPGFVTTPIEALFRADDLIVFESHIPKNLSLYKAEHNNKGPKTHEEFMQVIIKDGGVRLPELPEGDEYWYDPKTEKLMVRHPKPPQP